MEKQKNIMYESKECPVCHALCFSDMEVCYGCLHKFSEEDSRIRERIQEEGVKKSENAIDMNEKNTETFEVIKTLPLSSEQALEFQINVRIMGA